MKVISALLAKEQGRSGLGAFTVNTSLASIRCQLTILLSGTIFVPPSPFLWGLNMLYWLRMICL